MARTIGWLLVLISAGVVAALIDNWADPPREIVVGSQQVRVADGDSFSVGVQKIRVDGIDAPEYRQICQNESGVPWDCGKASRASLELMLKQPGLSCVTDATDKYGRSIATCSTAQNPDIGAAQVMAGMAVSHEYFGARDYGEQQDAAQMAKRGIWVGEFTPPDQWRETHSPSQD